MSRKISLNVTTAISANIKTRPIAWIIPSRFGLMGFLRMPSMIRKKSLPPSSPGIGSKLNTPILIVPLSLISSSVRYTSFPFAASAVLSDASVVSVADASAAVSSLLPQPVKIPALSATASPSDKSLAEHFYHKTARRLFSGLLASYFKSYHKAHQSKRPANPKPGMSCSNNTCMNLYN